MTILFGAIGGALTVLQAQYLTCIIDRVFLQRASLADVIPFLGWLALCILGRAACTWASEAGGASLAARIKIALRERLYWHALSLGPLWARGERTGELANAMTEGIEALDVYFSGYLPQLALAALIPLTILGFVLPIDPLSALILFLTAPLIPIFMRLIGSASDALTRRQWESLSRLSAHFFDVLQGLTTLKILGRSRDQIETIRVVTDRFRQATLSVLRVAFLSALALELVSTISTAVVAVTVGLRLLYGHLTFGQAFFVLLLAPEFYLPLRLLGIRFHAGISGITAAQRIFAILESEPIAPPPSSPPEVGRRAQIEPPLTVRFHGVSCQYPDAMAPALTDVSFTIEPGQKVAVVGPTGAGKSTLTHLLLRFLEPTMGYITINGMPLREIDPAEWRSLIAWVPQMPYLFHDTVAANIRLAKPDASMDQVVEAARLAHAHEFICELPDGYYTVIGERGQRLSGGQAQRLALARAFLKNAPLLILDEPSASLDPEHEHWISQAIQRLLQRRSALIIAHRLNTIREADQILVLDGGRLVQMGRHVELIEQPGLYRQLILAGGTIP
ncbi:MAG: thiol reductant ABC exporter subunit CydD [Anaerolineae bacterium]|nr:thiol reductant ABC exporter subunit CydD [Anaerolineae bacterium]